MATDKLVIRRERHPVRQAVRIALWGALAAGATLGAYQFGTSRGLGDAGAAVGERGTLQEQIREMAGETATLRDQLARLKSEQRIDREAHAKVRASLGRVQQQNLELREELQFYRNIVSPSQAAPGLQVQRFAIEPAVGPGQYRYKLTLVHLQGAKKGQSLARGRLEVYIDGSMDEGRKRLRLEEVATPGGAEFTYSIKYFKHFEGELRLPEGFQPDSALVEVIPRGGDEPALEKRIRWPGAASG